MFWCLEFFFPKTWLPLMEDFVPPEFFLTQNQNIQNIPHSVTTNRTAKLSTAISNFLVPRYPRTRGKPGEKEIANLAAPLKHFNLHFLSSHVASSQMVKGVTQRKLSTKISFPSNIALHLVKTHSTDRLVTAEGTMSC